MSGEDDDKFDLDSVEQGDLDDVVDDPAARGDFVGDDTTQDDAAKSKTGLRGSESASSDDDDDDDDDSGDDEEDSDDDSADDSDDSESDDSDDSDGSDDDDSEEGNDDSEDDDDDSDEQDDGEEDSERNVIRVPKGRFDKVNERRKAAEKRSEELERRFGMATKAVKNEEQEARKTEIATELKAVQQKLNKAIVDADEAAIAEHTEAQESLNNELTDIKISEAAAVARVAAIDEAKFDNLIDSIEADYPEFNPDSEQHNEDLVNETVQLSERLQTSGSTRTEAMLEAFDLMRAKYRLDEVEIEAEEEREQGKPKKRTTKTKRNKNAKESQAPKIDTKTTALSDDRVDVANMSPEELDKLDPKVLAELRGDTLPVD